MSPVLRLSVLALAAGGLMTAVGCAQLDWVLGKPATGDANEAAATPGNAASPSSNSASAKTRRGQNDKEVASRGESFDPKALIGLDTAATQDTLGSPNEVREGSPATVWRYVAKNCVLDIYFYADLDTRALRALAYDVSMAKAADRESVQACAGQIRADYRAGKR